MTPNDHRPCGCLPYTPSGNGMGGIADWFSTATSYVKDTVFTPAVTAVKDVMPTASDLQTTIRTGVTTGIQTAIAREFGQSPTAQPTTTQQTIPSGVPTYNTTPATVAKGFGDYVRENPGTVITVAAVLATLWLKNSRKRR